MSTPVPDSRPLHFSSLDLQEMSVSRDQWLERTHPLDYLTLPIMRDAVNEAMRGAWSNIQWIWHNIEQADTYLSVCVDRRLAALKKLRWDIRPKDGLTDAEACLADAQARTLTDFCNAIDNMEEGIAGLAQASFRHYRHLQLLETDTSLRLNLTDNWNWCRDGYKGPWRWNPEATYGATIGKDLPVSMDSIITRICPRPIDQVAMLLVFDRKNGKCQLAVYNGRYGTPPMYIIMPDGISEEQKKAFIEFGRQCLSNSAGVLPPGSKVETVQPGSLGPDSFTRYIDMASQEIVLRCTGGLMTMLTAPGEGTTTSTGNAHQDAFDAIAAAEGEDIAALLQRHLFAPALNQWHPGQPHLVEFTLAPLEDKGTSEIVQSIAMLASAGYRLTDDQVAELTGLDVTSANMDARAIYAAKSAGFVPTQQSLEERMGMPLAPVPLTPEQQAAGMLNSMHRRFAPTMLWPQARRVYDAATAVRMHNLSARPAAQVQPEDGITAEQRAILTRLASMPLDPARIEAKAESLRKALQEAIAPYAPDDASDAASPHARPMHGAARGTSEQDGDNHAAQNAQTSPEDEPVAENYGTSEGAKKGWDKRGRGRKDLKTGFGHAAVGKTGTAEQLGLGRLKDISPDPASTASHPGRAKRGLTRGFSARSIDGQNVHFTRDVLDHWEAAGKTSTEQARRLRHLSEAVRAVKSPHEIWENPRDGQRTYLRSYKDASGHYVLAGFVVGKTGNVRTYFHNRRLSSMEKTRKGTLKYKRD
ncbi:phage portal protein family protein [Akkermansia glycaniphila]|uniref:Phage-Barnase-EndoU-ColicinE5/D-RelE like nuclease 2 domain-containing protein n=1 Tax=Akkermansia glycaniphila TaxID=1679444 RepID=A0A1C7PE60_9BACT|nr:DUF935 family protein [Akkermansia glycaniphila]OCA02312.1 hypothetical protein AC781_10800 [Akkermansia glycaniphila]OCA04202.1 hypothetical protein AC781_00470 [Akkermansia glycaniphila]SEH87542.1 protein of unknown function (duf935) [Akkermansia glycaniphila]